MNDPLEPLSDELIDDLLAPLRAAKPPHDVSSTNREAVQRALARRAEPPWWRRQVAVPVPIAIAATLALVVTAAASLWSSSGQRTIARESLQPLRAEAVETYDSSNDELDHAAGPGWSVTRSYILSIESLAKMRCFFPPDVTEN